MTDPGPRAEDVAPLERAENEDDETRLAALESLHSGLEAELERDAPRPEPGSPA